MIEYLKKEDVIKILFELGALKECNILQKIKTIKPTHGPCCTCQSCGYYYDDCVCTHNEIVDTINSLTVIL